MVAFRLLAGLAMAAPATALSTITVWLPNLPIWASEPPIWGSVVAANQEATTVNLNCPGAWRNSPACALYNHLTIVYGPSTVAYAYTQYHADSTTTRSDGPLYETMTCELFPLSAVCLDTFTDSGGEAAWSMTAIQTFSHDDMVEDYPHRFTITSGVPKPTTSHHGSSSPPRTTVVTTPFSSSTAPAATTPFTSFGTPGGSSSVQAPGSLFNTTTTPTGARSATHPESTTSVSEVPVNGAHSLSAQQHPVVVGIAALVGAAVILM